MSCTVALSNSPVFSPSRVPVPASLRCKVSSSSSSSSPETLNLTHSPSKTSSSPSSPSSPLRILRLQKPPPSNLIRASNTDCSTSTVLKRKRPTRLDLPVSSMSFGNFPVTPAGVADLVEVEGDGYSVCCKRGRKGAMEDRHSAMVNLKGDSKQGVFGIFDGHGGVKAAEFSAENLNKNIMNELGKTTDDKIEVAVKNGYLKTDTEFLSQEVRGGSCCVTALIQKGNLVVSNAGDCRAVVSRGGLAEALTSDHRPSRKDEKDRIEGNFSVNFHDFACLGFCCFFVERQMSGVSLGESHGRPWTGKKTSRRCNDGTGADHVVLIDVECETFGNVIFIDVPESTPKKFRGKTAAKKDKGRSPLRNIIFIDDDESNGNEYPKFGLEDDHHFFHDPSPSMRPCSSSRSAKEPLDEIDDDCQFVRENISPVKLSKCKRTYSGKSPVQNRYGLMSDSESSSSDDDEVVMGDYSGLLREEWQKAFLKRKNDNSGQSGVGDINSVSTVGIQPEPGESKEHPVCPGNSKSSTEKENLSPRSTCESHCNETGSFNGKEDLLPGGSRWWTTGSSVKHKSDCNYSNGSVCLRESSNCRGASSGIRISGKRCVDQEYGKWIPDRTSELSSNHNETQPRNSGSLLEEDLSESVSMSQHKDERHNDVNGEDGENVERCVENCITTERERFKETSEYKKALEEELASRQRALAIQAQESKKMKLLLKRKKAESMRLLEMEKRQKQRVEEIRETQKKDVENMNLKEQIRAEVRMELSKLEITCHDMASVLSGLGITVGAGTSHEVRAAYKKALLKFHPDRASRSDLQQQVEAEEKFKLISRMKDKYLPTL